MKRLLDVTVAAAVLLVAAPVMAAVAVAIWATMGRPVLFRQMRPGYKERPFMLVKFRTMRNAVGVDGRPLPDGQRLTRLGRLLRKTSLDELPQLWNVLRGELSLIGPRPLLMQYLDRYTPEQRRRHDVKPGITGWSQINGRNSISWDDKFKLDLWYVDHQSLRLDLWILILTAWKVVRREGVDSAADVPMPEFLGEAGKVGS